MPRPKLPKAQKLTEITFTKLRLTEKRALEKMSRARKRKRLPGWSGAAILREGFVSGLAGRKPDWAKGPK